MICAYKWDETDFTKNGLGPLMPISCEVSETMNGMWELTMVHPIDEYGKHERLALGNIIKAPVPAGRTPAVHYAGSGETSVKEIWRIDTNGGLKLTLRQTGSQSARALGYYKHGTEVVVLEKAPLPFYEVSTPDGKHGFMHTANLRNTGKTTSTGTEAEEEIVEEKALREQPFRIYALEPGLDRVTVKARHVFYDLADVLLGTLKIEGMSGHAAANAIFSNIRGGCPDGTRIYSDLNGVGSAEWTDKTPVEALMGSEGLCETWSAEIARDWWDVYAVERVGRDTGIELRQGKNIRAVGGGWDVSDVATKIMPVGETKDGDPLYLPEIWVERENAGSGRTVCTKLDVKEAKIGSKDENGNKRTEQDCLTLMRETAQKAFVNGCDIPNFTLDVDFVDLSATEEFAEWKYVNDLSIGDSVTIVTRGLRVRMRMTDYVYDCLKRQYKSASFGDPAETLSGSMVSAKQLPTGGVTGSKLAYHAVGAQNIADGSVNSLKIGLAAIDYAHMKTATISQLSADAITAVRADVRELVAEKITTDQFYADLAEIATAQITTAHIKNATIDWAQITTLSAEIAKVAQAEIKSATIDGAHIKNASIDTAQIKNGAISTALIGTGAVNTAQIADGSITDAKIVELTANKINAGTLSVERLVISGSNKSLVYAINNMGDLVSTKVDTIDGNVLTPRTVTADKIVANAITAKEIASKTITANEIAANTITAGQIASGTITATQIDVANLFAAQATVAALDAYIIKANTITALKGQLDVWAGDKINLGIKNIDIGGANLLAGTRKTIDILQKQTADSTFYEYGDDYPEKKLRVGDSVNQEFAVYVIKYDHIVGEQYTFSVDVANFGNDIRLRVNNDYTDWQTWNNAVKRLSITYTATQAEHWLRVICRKKGTATSSAYMDVRKFKVEYGNMATAWRESDEEFRAGSAIEMTKDKVIISTPEFAVDLPGANDLHMDKDGASMGNLDVTGSFSAPNIARVTKSQNFEVGNGKKYTTLKQVADIINNTMLIGVVKIYLTSDVYGDAVFGGLFGNGQLELRQQGYTIYGSLSFEQCSRLYLYDTKINLPSNSANAACLTLRAVTYAYITNGILTGKSATTSGTRSLLLVNGSKVYVADTQMYNSIALMEAQYGCVLTTANLSGGNCTNFLYGYQFILSMRGTRPDGTLSQTASIMYPANPATLTVNAGSAQPITPSTTTVTLSPSDYCTNYNTSSWQSKQSQLYQGMYGSDKYRSVYWFSNSGLSGKTVKAATLTLKRVSGSGSGAAISIHLWGTPLASASGNPTTNRVDYGEIGTLTYGETAEFSIPLTAAQAFASGSIKGFIIDPNDSAVGSRGYSANYGKLESAAVLKITY